MEVFLKIRVLAERNFIWPICLAGKHLLTKHLFWFSCKVCSSPQKSWAPTPFSRTSGPYLTCHFHVHVASSHVRLLNLIFSSPSGSCQFSAQLEGPSKGTVLLAPRQWPDNMPLYGYATLCWSVHQPMGIGVVSTFSWLMLLGTRTGFAQTQAPQFSRRSSGSGLLSLTVTLCLAFWGTADPFSRAAAPSSSPASGVWALQPRHIYATLNCGLSRWASRGISLWFRFSSPWLLTMLNTVFSCVPRSLQRNIYSNPWPVL